MLLLLWWGEDGLYIVTSYKGKNYQQLEIWDRYIITKWNFFVCFLLSASSESETENLEAQPQSTVRPEEIPPIPENRFLMRKSPPKADEKERKNREREREREWYVNVSIF